MIATRLALLAAIAATTAGVPPAQAQSETASTCQTFDVSSDRADKFYFEEAFGRLGVVVRDAGPKSRIAALTRRTCYDMSRHFRDRGWFTVVVNHFIAAPTDLAFQYSESTSYFGLQVIALRPAKFDPARVSFIRAGAPRGHVGRWALPRDAAREIEPGARVTARDVDLDTARNNVDRDLMFDHGRSPGLSARPRLDDQMAGLFGSRSRADVGRQTGNWHAWVVAPTREEGEFTPVADTFQQHAAWALKGSELRQLFDEHSADVRNYLHLLTPTATPSSAEERRRLLADRSHDSRFVRFSVPMGDAKCFYIRHIAERRISDLVPLYSSVQDRFIVLARDGRFPCPGPAELSSKWKYWLALLFGYDPR